MIFKLKRLLTLGLCFSFLGSTLLSWGQDLRLSQALDRAVAEKMPTTRKQMFQAYWDTFDYPDIIQALYKLHDIYNNAPLIYEDFMPKDAVQKNFSQEEIRKEIRDNIKTMAQHNPWEKEQARDTIMPMPKPNFKLGPVETNKVLVAIAHNKLTPEDLLDYIDPLTSTQNQGESSWENTLYAIMYLNSSLGATPSPYEGLEHFLRHAQMRVAYRLSALPPLMERSYLQTQVIAQLRLCLLMLHITYKRLYGKDPLEDIKGPFPFRHDLPTVVVTPKGASGVLLPWQGAKLQSPTGDKTVYDLVRGHFYKDIAKLKKLLPNDDRYSFSTFVAALLGKNRTDNFSAGQALIDIAEDFFWITPTVQLGQAIFGKNDTTPLANFATLVPSTAQFELLQGNFSSIKQLIHLLEPEKLAEYQYGSKRHYGAIFKNDALERDMQPAIVEVFNILYMYAITPGRSVAERKTILNMLLDFADPNQYSITTRVAAISVAAKLINIRQDVAYRTRVGMEETDTDPSWNLVKLPGEIPNPGYTAPVSQALAKRRPYADQMAQYIVDIYDTLTTDNTYELQSYGLDAKGMKKLANELARLYNIFALETQERYPRILSAGNENVEEVRGYDDKGLPVLKLHSYGARVKTSGGKEVELFIDNSTNSTKYKKTAQDIGSDLLVAVASWKAIGAVFKLGKAGLQATMRFVLPTTKALPKTLSLQTMIRPGIEIDEIASQQLKYIIEHPVPNITSRAELTQFLGLNAGVSDKTIQRSLKQAMKKYHTDRFVKITSEEGLKYVHEQAAKIGNLQNMMRGKNSLFKGTPLISPFVGEKGTSSFMIRTLESWAPTTAWFVRWEAIDAAASLINVPLEEKNAKYQQQYIKMLSPSTSDIPEVTAEEMPTDFLNNLSYHEVKASDGSTYRIPYIDRRGAIFRLPFNLFNMVFVQNSGLDSQTREQLQLTAHNVAYAKAEKQGLIVGFKEQTTQIIENLEKNKTDDLKYNSTYLAAIQTGRKELKRAYQIYIQDLKHSLVLADQDLAQAGKISTQSELKFANTRTNILIRAIKAFSAQTLPQALAEQESTLRRQFPDVITDEDISQLAELTTRLARADDEYAIRFLTAIPQALTTGQDVTILQAAAKTQFDQTEALLQKQVDQIRKRLQDAQNAVSEKALWREVWNSTVSGLQERFNRDTERMHPSGIKNYPQIQERIDAIFNTCVQEVNTLLETAQQNEKEGLLDDEENFLTFIQKVNDAVAKRDAAFEAIEKELNEQGIELFAPQEPEQPQDSLINETIY